MMTTLDAAFPSIDISTWINNCIHKDCCHYLAGTDRFTARVGSVLND